jgi:hypothetical protein
VLYWSLGKDGWASTGPFGRTVLPLEQALRFIATEDIFWALLWHHPGMTGGKSS